MDAKLFIDRIETLRKTNGLTQEELAVKIGMTRANYSRLIKRPWTINFKQIADICSALKIEIGQVLIEDYILIKEQKTWYKEFFEISIIHWIHDYLPEILKLYKHNLAEDNLTISSKKKKSTLSDYLLSRVKGEIVGNLLSIDLEEVLTNFLINRDIIIYYFSKKEGIIWVDMINESDHHHRGFKKFHPSLVIVPSIPILVME